MSNLTANDVNGLMEAYVAVYAQQETLLEQDPNIVYAPKGGKPGGAILGPDGKVKKWQELDPSHPLVKEKQAEYEKIKSDRATKQRNDLQVVKGGSSGYRSLMPKPTKQKDETLDQYSQRLDRYLQSKQLEKKLNASQAKIRSQSQTPTPPSEVRNDSGGRRSTADQLRDIGQDDAASTLERQSNSSTDSPAPSAPTSSPTPVLSKQDGVEGTGVGKDFKARAWSDAERQRYTSVAAKGQSQTQSSTDTAKPSNQLSPGGRSSNDDLEGKTFPMGTTKGGTKYEIRTPTRAEMEASRKAGGGEAGVKAAVERSSKLMGGPEGPGSIDASKIPVAFDPSSSPSSSPAVDYSKAFKIPAPAGGYQQTSFNPTSSAPEVKATNTIAAMQRPAPVKPIPRVVQTSTRATTPPPGPSSPVPRGTSTTTGTPRVVQTSTPVPKPTPRQQRLNMEMEYDAFDLVLEYLLSEGHADTVDEALYVMMEMDAETIGSICEAIRN